jgi:hypothetical protein
MTRLQVLDNAVRTALRNGTLRSEISVPEWSRTYKLPQATIRRAWEDALTNITNSAAIGEGK